MNQNIDIESIEKPELDQYIRLFIKEKRSDQLLLCSRLYDLSQHLDALDLTELDQLKCVANTLKLYGSEAYYQQHIDLKIVKLLEKNQYQFVVLRILFFSSVTYSDSIQSYGTTVVSKILEILKSKNDNLTEEALKCLYNYLNFYSLVKVEDPLQNALIDSGFQVDELFLIVRELVLNESVTSSALNCLLQFKDYIASQVLGKSKVDNPVELIHSIVVEQKDKELVDYLIKYLDERFTYENEETGTVFGIIAYLFSWMCYLAFPINENEKIKPWLLYLKSILLPENISRHLVLGADSSLPHRIISAFSATATLGITKEEVVTIPNGDVRPPPMSAFVSERLQELVFNLFEENVDQMVQYTGIGIVIGFLINRGLFTPQLQEKYSNGAGSTWNPVTGQTEDDDLYKDIKEMTDEEKEIEAEKLFVLFERLNKAGIKVELKRDENK